MYSIRTSSLLITNNFAARCDVPHFGARWVAVTSAALHVCCRRSSRASCGGHGRRWASHGTALPVRISKSGFSPCCAIVFFCSARACGGDQPSVSRQYSAATKPSYVSPHIKTELRKVSAVLNQVNSVVCAKLYQQTACLALAGGPGSPGSWSLPDGAISGGYASLGTQHLISSVEPQPGPAPLLMPFIAVPSQGGSGAPIWGVPLSVQPAGFAEQALQQQVSCRTAGSLPQGYVRC